MALSNIDLSEFFFSEIDGRTRAKLVMERTKENILKKLIAKEEAKCEIIKE